jgi:sulfur relay protein TusB/DsrH
MLFLLNKTQPDTYELIQLLGGEEEKEALLVEDAVFYGTEFLLPKLQAAGVERVYAAEDSVQERSVALSPECEVIDYDRIVDLIMEEHDKVVCI